MTYIVRIVGPSGRELYLNYGYLSEMAWEFYSARVATKAMETFMAGPLGKGRVAEILSTDDLEAGSVA